MGYSAAAMERAMKIWRLLARKWSEAVVVSSVSPSDPGRLGRRLRARASGGGGADEPGPGRHSERTQELSAAQRVTGQRDRPSAFQIAARTCVWRKLPTPELVD